MRNAFIQTLLECAKRNPDVELITGDLGFGVLKPFWEALPDQFLDVGIAEQNMTSIAAGIALEGKTVFTYSIGNFSTLRCIEQIRNDCAYHNANVKIVCVGGGFVYGSLGMSHHATEDLAIMRAIPNIHVFAPADAAEASAVARAVIDIPGTCYIRLGRGGTRGFAAVMSNYTGFWYNITFFILVVLFTYFYTAVTVNPTMMADEMRKNGGFIPGVKPGKKTAEYLDTIMSRVTLPGSIFLGLIAILPAFAMLCGVNNQFASFYGGTSLLILVGVVLDTLQQIESHLLMRHYDGLMKTGRLKGRSGM